MAKHRNFQRNAPQSHRGSSDDIHANDTRCNYAKHDTEMAPLLGFHQMDACTDGIARR